LYLHLFNGENSRLVVVHPNYIGISKLLKSNIVNIKHFSTLNHQSKLISIPLINSFGSDHPQLTKRQLIRIIVSIQKRKSLWIHSIIFFPFNSLSIFCINLQSHKFLFLLFLNKFIFFNHRHFIILIIDSLEHIKLNLLYLFDESFFFFLGLVLSFDEFVFLELGLVIFVFISNVSVGSPLFTVEEFFFFGGVEFSAAIFELLSTVYNMLNDWVSIFFVDIGFKVVGGFVTIFENRSRDVFIVIDFNV
jgi:hypothetical protein